MLILSAQPDCCQGMSCGPAATDTYYARLLTHTSTPHVMLSIMTLFTLFKALFRQLYLHQAHQH
jgi:hypothetical protein